MGGNYNGKTSVHHYRPLSLRGIDNECNKWPLPNKEHDLVHQTLNVNNNVLRALRMDLNDVIIFTVKKLEKVHNVQKMYFSKMDLLPTHLIGLHADSFTRQIIFREYQIKSLQGMLPDEEKFIVDAGRKQPPNIKNGKHQELLDESMQKLYKLFDLEAIRANKQIEYVKKIHNI